MAGEASAGRGASGGPTDGRDRHAGSEIDWIAAERSPEFRELIAKRRAFVLPATIFFFVWYFGFIALSGYAPDFMGTPLYGSFTVGYLLALTQFLMVWILAGIYLVRAGATFDPLAEKAARTAVEAGRTGRRPEAGPDGEAAHATERSGR